MSDEKIFLSPPGVFCGAGVCLEELFENCTLGNQKGISKVKTMTGQEFFVGKIDDSLLQKKSQAEFDMRISRIQEAALVQLVEYVEKAKNEFGANRVAVCVGSCDNGTEFSIAGHKKYFETGEFPENYAIEIQVASNCAKSASSFFSLKGPSLAFSTACSSGASAIIKGAQLIKAGIVDAVLVGGCDIASDTVLLGFDSLGTISKKITNPFSKNRSGITLGEGAAFFVMSKKNIFDSHAILLKGWGESADAYHITSPDPEGGGAFCAMQNALQNSHLKIEEISYINLHGTGTKANDSMEAKSIAKLFDALSLGIPTSSTKPLTGHTLGAAAAIEAAICYGTLVFQKIPVQVWDKEFDDSLPRLNFASSPNSKCEIKNCISNSFAFGGANVSLVIGIEND